MKPNTDRPAATAIGDKVHVFVGGAHQVMTIAAAERLDSQIQEAVAKAKASASEEPKRMSNEVNERQAPGPIYVLINQHGRLMEDRSFSDKGEADHMAEAYTDFDDRFQVVEVAAVAQKAAEPAQPVEAVSALTAALNQCADDLLAEDGPSSFAIAERLHELAAFEVAALAHPRPTGDVAGFDRTIETPRRQQAVEKMLALGWTYNHENGWTAPTGAVALISIFPSGDPVLQPVEGWEQLSLGNHLLYATTTVEQTGEVVAWHYRDPAEIEFNRKGSITQDAELVRLMRGAGGHEITALVPSSSIQPRPVGVPDGPLTGKYGDVLMPFIALMERELHANAGKGDRPGWLAMDRKTALLEIFYHLAKLQKAAKDDDAAGIREYAADVANMSMMLVDVCGLLLAAPEVPRG